jgi:hypothetical protein
MIPLNYSIEVTIECGPADTNVVAFIKAASIIKGRDTIERPLCQRLWC